MGINLFFNVSQHELDQFFNTEIVLPSPILPGSGIVEHLRPGVCNELSAVRLVGDLRVCKVLFYLFVKFFRSKTHCRYIIYSILKVFVGRYQKLPNRSQAVIDVHHWQSRVRLQIALILAGSEELMKNSDRVIGGAPAGRVRRDDARESEAPEIQTEFVVVVLPEELCMHLRHPIYGFRPLYGHVRSRVPRRVRPKRTYCARNKNLEMVLLRQFDHIVQALDIHPHRERDVLLTYCAEKSAEMNQPVDAMGDYNVLQSLEVEYVREYVRAAVDDSLRRFDNVRNYYVLPAVDPS